MKRQVAIERDAHRVLLSIECDSTYDAINLFRDLCMGAREGMLRLEVPTTQPLTLTVSPREPA